MARILPTRRWSLVELARARKWLLVQSARAKVVWPDIKTTLEFKLGLSLFLASIAALAVLSFL
jgi:hypothetical protein